MLRGAPCRDERLRSSCGLMPSLPPPSLLVFCDFCSLSTVVRASSMSDIKTAEGLGGSNVRRVWALEAALASHQARGCAARARPRLPQSTEAQMWQALPLPPPPPPSDPLLLFVQDACHCTLFLLQP